MVLDTVQLDLDVETHRELFALPTYKSLGLKVKGKEDEPVIYLCGNSLGLMPLQTREYLNNELDAWGARGVESHFRHPNGTSWVDIDLPLIPSIASVVGSKETEVAIMGSLTANLNALLVAFYKPKGKRVKILFERNSFPSDHYAFYNIVRLNGLKPEDVLIELEPRNREYTLRTEDIISTIEQNKDELALVIFSGIQYYTGQFFEISKITNATKSLSNEIVVGWDLAHAVGNVPLELHNWNVDFATWCSYKYLNSGPGGISGIFIHESIFKEDPSIPRLSGWWGNNDAKRFQMLDQFEPIEGALGFRMSNPSVLDVVSLKSSLDIFQRAGGVKKLREKSVKLTEFLESLLHKSDFYITPEESFDYVGKSPKFTIITPQDKDQRGSQLSLLFFPRSSYESTDTTMLNIATYLNQNGVICDERKPDVIRLAPIALYNTFEEISNSVRIFTQAFEYIIAQGS